MNFSWLFLFSPGGYWDNIIAVCSLLLSVYLLACLLKPVNLLETILFSFCIATALIAVWGYILSPFSQLAELSAWAWIGCATTIIALLLFVALKPGFIPLHKQIRASVRIIAEWYSTQTTRYEKAVIVPMAVVSSALAIFNLALVILIPPASWDSMTYHLPRMAYYLQQGNFSFFGANYWAQVVHPKNSAALLIYTFLTTGRNENLTQLVQYISYLIFVLCIYGISMKVGLNRTQGVFSALVGSLLIVGIIQIITAQNDLSLAAYFGAVTYGILAFRERPRAEYLLISGLGIASALGTKSSALAALPSIVVIAVYALVYQVDKKTALKNLLRFGVFTFLFMLALVLPSGYIENYQRFGSPIGPQDVRRMHSFESQSLGYIMKGGFYNTLRFGFDILSFDGLPQTESVKKAQYLIRFIPKQITSLLGIDLESDFAVGFSPFDLTVDRTNGWGVLGFGMIWAAVVLALFRFAGNKDAFILSVAAVIFFLAQSFSGPYDTARGRYFLICALFAVPVSGIWIAFKPKWLKIYLAVVLFAGCVCAISVAINAGSLFSKDRIQQLMFRNPKYYERIKAFDFATPKDAVVAVYLYPNTYEYPLFGQHLTRTIIPINSFDQGLQPVPDNAEYLLYVKGYPCPDEKDKHLKGDWFLRKLNENNRVCKFP
jgi:hypothetical protein